ncbi:hypothetical protein IAQ61_001938 [Plenodomus lingam]|uniref:uncharacterized protein n=1 Tax=Leptosphaeria maculans TaxID=5022 RepID=UPI003330D163|nr:hypothetical protein IAQ61_001938 [Plenodomus lingam]
MSRYRRAHGCLHRLYQHCLGHIFNMQFVTTAVASLLFLGTAALPYTPHPTFCGIRGYDYLNKPYDVQQDSRIRTLDECRFQCLLTSRCISYAVGKGACVLYDYDTLETFVPYEGSKYLFYDRSCDPESYPTEPSYPYPSSDPTHYPYPVPDPHPTPDPNPTPDPYPTPSPNPNPNPPSAPGTCSSNGLPSLFTCGSDLEVYGHIQILDSNTDVELGYINLDIWPYNIFQKSPLDRALVVKATYTAPDCSNPNGVALELMNVEGSNIQPGYLGTAGSFQLSDLLGLYGYSSTTVVTLVPPNVLGLDGLSADNNFPIQASVWTLDLTCGYLTSTLINPDNSPLPVTQILDYADCQNGCLHQTRNEAAFLADHPRREDVVVVRFRFVPFT